MWPLILRTTKSRYSNNVRGAHTHTFQENIQAWLVDPKTMKGLDQFVVRQGDYTDIMWHDFYEKQPVVEASRTVSTSFFLCASCKY